MRPLNAPAGPDQQPCSAQRRRLAGLLALTPWALGLKGCAGQRPDALPQTDFSAFRLTADFEPAAAVWLGWDAGHAGLSARLVAALRPHVALKVLASGPEAEAEARAGLASHGQAGRDISLLSDPQAIYFVRDAAVFAIGPKGARAIIDFQWSQYGLPGWCRQRHVDEPRRAAACAADADSARDALDRQMAKLARTPTMASNVALEGGGIEFNGQGLALVSQSYLLQRNPGHSRDDLERELLRLPSLRKIIWLAEGLAEDPLLRATVVGDYVAWGTGGHSDEFVRFADPRTVLLAWPDDADAASHPVSRLSRQRMQRNFDILSRAGDADGRPLRVIKLPTPRPIERRVYLSAAAQTTWSQEWTADFFPAAERRWQGQRVTQVACASYLNFVVANGVVVVPDYLPHGTPKAVQDRVKATFEQVFPDRQLVWLDVLGYNWVGGGAHCATLNEPQSSS